MLKVSILEILGSPGDPTIIFPVIPDIDSLSPKDALDIDCLSLSSLALANFFSSRSNIKSLTSGRNMRENNFALLYIHLNGLFYLHIVLFILYHCWN